MENTCVLHFLPVIPKWKVYNLLQIKPVEYYSILQQKREFQGLLKKALDGKYSKTGSCSIDSKLNSSFENEKNIDIIFLSETNTLSLSLRIQEKHALKGRNNILVYLKKVSNDITYEIKNDSLYTKCKENIKWKIFYSLFEFLLLRYRTSIIGAIFYNYVILDHILMNEKTLLYQLTIENTSALKPYSQLSKQNQVYSEEETLRNVNKNQEDFSFNSLQFDKSCVALSSQNFISKVSNLRVKRKAVDVIQSSCKLFKQDYSDKEKCFCLKTNCKCHKSRWQVLKNIETCNVDSYMDILLSKGVLCDTEFSDSLSNGLDTFQDEPLVHKNISVSLHQTDENDQCDVISPKQLPEDSVKLVLSKKIQNEEKTFKSKSTEKDISCQETAVDVKINEIAIEQSGRHDLPKCASRNDPGNSGLRDIIKKEDFSTLFSEFIDEEVSEANCSFSMFKTAGGKKVKISETALKSAEKMFGDVLTSEETGDFEMETFDKSTFKTDYKSRIKTPVYKPPHFPKQPNIKNDIDETIDGALAEKMFEEICFDEREVDTCSEMLCAPSLPSTFASNVNEKMVSSGKVRKSLGGRRSLKPYSVPSS